MYVLEGTTLYDKGKLVGQLILTEGQKSDVFCIMESCSGPLTVTKPTESDASLATSLVESDGKKPKVLLTLEGIFQRADTKNANGRIYPNSIWTSVLEPGSKCMKSIEHGDMIGECDHPKDGETLLNRAAGKVTKLWRSENNSKEIMGRMVIFDTTSGRNLKAIHDGGGRLGVSSRGNGSVVRMDGNDVVQSDYDLQTWDAVYAPSTPGAYPNEVEESKNVLGSPITRTEALRVSIETLERAEKERLPIVESARRPRSLSEIAETVSILPVEKGKPLGEAMASVRERYRKLAGVEGPLTEEESKAISVFVQHAHTGKIQAGTGPLVARITFKGGVLSEEIGTAEIRAATMEDLKRLVEDRIGSLGGAVEVEYDRSEEIYEECAKRFSTLLEAQTTRISELTTKLTDVEDHTRKAQGKVTELSAKLSAATHVIGKFAARTKLAEDKMTDLFETTGAAEKLIEALADEFKEEGLRSAVAAIAATNPDVADLAYELSEATSLSEVILITKRLKERRFGIMEREPLGIREERVVLALKRSREAEEKLLKESKDTKKTDSPILSTTKTVVEALQGRGFK